MNTNTILNGDAAYILKSIDNDCIDLVVTSPPYDNIREYNGFTFDFPVIAKELFRVIKVGGVLVWVVGDQMINGSETGTSFKQALFFMDVGFSLHDTMIHYRNTIPQAHNRYEQQFEYMFVMSKGKPKTFNPIMTAKLYHDKRTIMNVHRDNKGIIKHAPNNHKPDKYIGNVWYIPVGGGRTTKDTIAFDHPAIFPEALAERHIITWSNPGDIVLDPFCGSGTTLKMAVQTGRHYLGIDISPEYVDLANKRLMSAQIPLIAV